MLRILLILLAIGMISGLSATAQQLQWKRSFSNDSADRFDDVIRMQDGSFCAVGGDLVIRFDSNGIPLWKHNLENSTSIFCTALAETPDGGLVLAGTWSYRNGSKIVVIRTDAGGNELWRRFYSDTAMILERTRENEGRGIRALPDGGYLVAAYSGLYTSWSNAYLLRLNDDGDVLWTRSPQYAPGDIILGKMIALDDGTTAIAGYRTIFGSQGNRTRPLILRINSNGDTLPLWSPDSAFRSGSKISCLSVTRASDGGYLIVGGASSGVFDSTDLFVAKVDSLGNVVWDLTLDIAGLADYGTDITRRADGTFALLVNSRTRNDEGKLIYGLVVTGIDETGTLLWSWSEPDKCSFSSSLSLVAVEDGVIISGGAACSSSGMGEATLLKVSLGATSSVSDPMSIQYWLHKQLNLK